MESLHLPAIILIWIEWLVLCCHILIQAILATKLLLPLLGKLQFTRYWICFHEWLLYFTTGDAKDNYALYIVCLHLQVTEKEEDFQTADLALIRIASLSCQFQ